MEKFNCKKFNYANDVNFSNKYCVRRLCRIKSAILNEVFFFFFALLVPDQPKKLLLSLEILIAFMHVSNRAGRKIQ